MDWDCQTSVPGARHIDNQHLCGYVGLEVGFSLYKVEHFSSRIADKAWQPEEQHLNLQRHSFSYKTAWCYTVSLDVLL